MIALFFSAGSTLYAAFGFERTRMEARRMISGEHAAEVHLRDLPVHAAMTPRTHPKNGSG